MTRKLTKDDEKRYFERFLERSKLPLTVVEDDRESPDFVVEHEGTRVGIELVNLTDEGIARAHGTAKYMADALLDHVHGLGRNLGVIMYTRTNFREFRDAKERAEFVDRARALIDEACLRSPPIEVSLFSQDLAARGFSEIRTASIADLDPFYPAYVKILPLTGHRGGDRTLVEQRLREKEEKLGEYRQNSGLERQWLVMVTGVPGYQPVPGDMLGPARIESTFERVYVLDVMRGLVKGLKE